MPKDCVGLCIWPDRIIKIAAGLGERESFDTLIHEVVHAIAFSTNTSINHRIINRIECPLADVIKQLV